MNEYKLIREIRRKQGEDYLLSVRAAGLMLRDWHIEEREREQARYFAERVK